MNFTISILPNLVSNVTLSETVSLYIYVFAYCNTFIFGIPINSYVLWLICTRTRSEIVAEIFSLNLTVCEIVYCFTCLLCIVTQNRQSVLYITYFSVALPTVGRSSINCVICIERYLAVLHPVSFLKFKPLRYRLACSAVIWAIILGFGGLFVAFTKNMYKFICIYLPLFLIFFSIKLFCCLAIVRALKHPGPGAKGRNRKKANCIKTKAVVLILIITASMFVQYMPLIFIGLLYSTIPERDLVLSIGVAIFLMFGYVTPILYIYRVRNL